jgi:predicted MFS family arabinose efflux permease
LKPVVSEQPPPQTESLSSLQVKGLAVACTLAIATLYYSQPILPLIGKTFSTSDAMTSQVVMLGQFGYALGLFLFVPIGDRVDRRRLILTLLAVNTVSVTACALSPNFAFFGVATVIAGLTTVTPQIIIPTVAGMASPERRGRAVGVLLSGMSAGLLLGRMLSGFVGEYAGWRAVFGLAIILNTLLIAIVWRILPPTRPSSALPYPQLLRSLGRLFLAHSTLRAACITGFLAFGAFSTLWATLAALLAKPPYQLGANIVGLFGLIGAVSIFAAPVIGRLTDRLGTRFLIGAGSLILLTAFTFVSQAERSLWMLAAGIALIDIGYRCVLLANQTRIYPLEPAAQARLNTVFMTSVFLGGAAGSLCGGAAAAWSWTGVSVAGAALATVALVFHLLASRSAKSSQPVHE